MSIEYLHIDVFSRAPYRDNSLPMFPDASGLNAEQMLRLTQELRHFEAIFLEPTHQANTVRARVFDLSEELPFAEHPVIGAAALHYTSGCAQPQTWRIELPGKVVSITTEQTEYGYTFARSRGA
jgi:trans-2,3-dihydro-3-hydroxyanthranilate isomerase